MSIAHTSYFSDTELIDDLVWRGYRVKYGIRLSFDEWWMNIGSAIKPNVGDDHEEHAKRIARIAYESQ